VKRIYFAIMVVAVLAALVCAAPLPARAGTAWNSPKAGNPVLPGYFADPCCRKFGDTYYIYVTPDGWGVGAGPFAIWTSKDFVHWTAHKSPSVEPGKFWPDTELKWAPSVVKHGGKYYMYNQTPCMIWGAVGDTPLGPWKSLSEPGKPMIPDQTPKGTIVLDGECFIDTDGQIYIYYGTWWTPTGAKLNPDMKTISGQPKQFFRNMDASYNVQGCMEAPYMFKRNGIYYYMYSNNMCGDSSYDVEYSTGPSPMGPWTYGKNNPILSTNPDDTVDGPGHHTILEDNGKIYIIYHRHDNPHAADGAHRQTCADELHFNADGSIEKVVPSHSGVGYLAPSTVRDTDLALGKKATASSFAGENFAPAYTADENDGTLWKAGSYTYPQWLQIDLGKPERIKRAETEFQFAQAAYQYVIEYSNDGTTWKTFADRRSNKDWGPMIDKGDATARYFKITLTGDDSPQRPNPEIAIWNFKLYDGIDKPNQVPKVEAGPDVTGTINFPTRIVDGLVDDDGLPNGPVSVKWTKVSGPGSVTFEHADRAYSHVTFGAPGDYVLKLTADDGKLKGSDTVKFKILAEGDQLISYKFDEKGGAVAEDSSVNGQNGVMRIGTGRSLGMHGGALNMGGNDFVTVPPLGTQSSLTIATWINVHTLNADHTAIVCSAGDNPALQATIARTGEIRVALGSTQVAVSDFQFSPSDLGWWKHLAVAYDGTAKTVAFYVDGKLDCTRALVDAPKLDLSAGLKIGGTANGARGLDGEMDDFQLYSKAIPASEIAAMAKPVKFASIDDVKKVPDGTPVALMAKVVTYAPSDPITFERSTDYFFISERDGSAGIFVKDGDAGRDRVKVDTCVSFTGVKWSTDEGVKLVVLTSVPSAGAPYVARALESGTRENASLLKIKGEVVEASTDGTGFTVAGGNAQTKVVVDKGLLAPKISKGNTVEVTGVWDSIMNPVLLAKDIVRTNPPSDPLIAHYTFDKVDGNIVKDSSVNGNDATMVNNPTFVPGKIGNAICFDGKSSYMKLPDLGLQRSLTVALWVNETTLGSDNWSTALVHADGWNLGDLHFQIPCVKGNIGAAVNGAGDVNSRFVFVGHLNEWVHLAFTYDARAHSMALYVNGVQEGTSGFGEARPINLSHSSLGSWGGGSRFFDGKIDDLRIYDKALSVDEIAKLAQGE